MTAANTTLVKVPGIPFSFAGRVLILAPLNLSAMRQVLGAIQQFDKLPFTEQMDTVSSALLASLQRNYPDITPAVIEGELLDVTNLPLVLDVICNSSGLQSKAVNDVSKWDGAVLGEAQAA